MSTVGIGSFVSLEKLIGFSASEQTLNLFYSLIGVCLCLVVTAWVISRQFPRYRGTTIQQQFRSSRQAHERFEELLKMNDETQLISEARRLLQSSGDAQQDVARAMQALAALVTAVRIHDGDGAASALLERGRKLFQEREGTDREREDALLSLCENTSLLKERGAEIILNDAFKDGSSVLCRRCSGLVARSRWPAHKTQWCPALMNDTDLDILTDDNCEYDNDDYKMEIE